VERDCRHRFVLSESGAGLCRAVRRGCVLFDVSHAFAVECHCSAAGTSGSVFAEKKVSARTLDLKVIQQP
jgi:hypothetical protein